MLTFLLSGCLIQKCGDNKITGTEECEINLFNNKTCESYGFDGGPLTCNNCLVEVKKEIKEFFENKKELHDE